MGFIYKITNKINGKSYIGQTSLPIQHRWMQHQSNARLNKYGHLPLYRALRKYGVENFNFEILEECPTEQLNARESYYIELYHTLVKGYNCTKGGEGIRGFHHSAETKEKVRQASLQRDSAKFLKEWTSQHKGIKLTGERLAQARRAINIAMEAARGWHSTPEGKKWHKEQGEYLKGKCFMKTYTHTCPVCGTMYTTHKQYSSACSGKCKQLQRRINNLDKKRSVCSCCGKEILINKYSKGKYHFCGSSCANYWRTFIKGSQYLPTCKIASIEPCGTADVYNMEVENTHNFSVEGGLIVHNCLDALRYCTEGLSQHNFSF